MGDMASLQITHHDHKFDNLGEVNQILERPNLTKLTQKEINNLNRHIYVKQIKLIIIFKQRKHQSQMGSLGNSTKYLRKKLFQFSKIPQGIEAERILSNSLYKSSIILIKKKNLQRIKRKIQTNISPELRCKNQQNIRQLNSTMCKKELHTTVMYDLFQVGKIGSSFKTQIM